MLFVLGIICALVYVIGWNFWLNGPIHWGTILAWIFSPVTVPIALLILLIAY